MQELDGKTNQQKTLRRSAGVDAFDQRGRTAWRAVGFALRTAGSTRGGRTPALGLEAATSVTSTGRTDPDYAVINVTPGVAA